MSQYNIYGSGYMDLYLTDYFDTPTPGLFPFQITKSLVKRVVQAWSTWASVKYESAPTRRRARKSLHEAMYTLAEHLRELDSSNFDRVAGKACSCVISWFDGERITSHIRQLNRLVK